MIWAPARLIEVSDSRMARSRSLPPLAGADIGGPFALVDQDGRAVSDRAFAGKWRAIYFGYSFCPDVCPLDLQHLMKGVHAFAARNPAAAAKLRPIFITIDPARDTPAALKQYVAAFGPGLSDPTGGATDYLMDHSRQTILFDPDGKPIVLLPTDDSAAAVAAELARWLS